MKITQEQIDAKATELAEEFFDFMHETKLSQKESSPYIVYVTETHGHDYEKSFDVIERVSLNSHERVTTHYYYIIGTQHVTIVTSTTVGERTKEHHFENQAIMLLESEMNQISEIEI